MIYISHFKIHIPDIESANKQVSEFLPFYNDSYERLKSEISEREETSIVAPIAKNMTSDEMILQAFSENCVEEEPSFYLDIRSSETYSLPAPDYYILKMLGYKNTKPLNILGVADVPLIHAFSLFNAFEKNENYFIVSLSQRLEPRDIRNYEYILADGALSFIISNKKKDSCFCVERYFKTTNKDKLFSYLNKEDGEIILRNNTATRLLDLRGRIRRNTYEMYDFGCMDTVYTLLDAEANRKLVDRQRIVMVSVEANTYTAITIKYIKENREEQ